MRELRKIYIAFHRTSLNRCKKKKSKSNHKRQWQMNYRYLQPISQCTEAFFIVKLCLLMQLYVHAAMTEGHQLIIGRNFKCSKNLWTSNHNSWSLVRVKWQHTHTEQLYYAVRSTIPALSNSGCLLCNLTKGLDLPLLIVLPSAASSNELILLPNLSCNLWQ